jgi:hypothetical protein
MIRTSVALPIERLVPGGSAPAETVALLAPVAGMETRAVPPRPLWSVPRSSGPPRETASTEAM